MQVSRPNKSKCNLILNWKVLTSTRCVSVLIAHLFQERADRRAAEDVPLLAGLGVYYHFHWTFFSFSSFL